MSDSEKEEDEFEVESIVEKRLKKGEPEYLVKWKSWPAEDNTWEGLGNLEDSEDLVKAFEQKLKDDEKKPAEKRKAEPEKKSAKKTTTRPKGFCRNLPAESIIGATNDPGELYFLVKWKGTDETDLVAAKEANIKMPQVVIKFYEDRLNWYEDDK